MTDKQPYKNYLTALLNMKMQIITINNTTTHTHTPKYLQIPTYVKTWSTQNPHTLLGEIKIDICVWKTV